MNRIQSDPIVLDSGSLTIVDTGSGAGFFRGSGISGTNASGQDAVYQFNTIQDFQEFTRGGLWYDLANPLFNPTIRGLGGVSSIEFVRAATTTAATQVYTFAGGGSAGGTITLTTRDEGLAANGVLTSSVLTRGFAVQMIEDPVVSGMYQFQFYRGNFFGNDPQGNPYDGVTEADSQPTLLFTSGSFNTIAGFQAWAGSSIEFQNLFIAAVTITGTGAIDNADFTGNDDLELFTGATETYSTAALDEALAQLRDSRSSFILADNFEANARSTNNIRIVTFATSTARFRKQVYIAAGTLANQWTGANSTIATAQAFNSNFVSVVHGGVGFNNPDGSQRLRDSNYKAAALLGREAGLATQVPLTFKDISFDFERDPLSPNRLDAALDNGVLVTHRDVDFNAFVVLESVNSLQNNLSFINSDGTTYNKQLVRIQIELNKGIVVNGKQQLFSQEDGVNRNTLSAEDVRAWLQGYLSSVTAAPDADNLIRQFRNIAVETKLGAYCLTYEFEPNFEVKALFVTGFIQDLSNA